MNKRRRRIKRHRAWRRRWCMVELRRYDAKRDVDVWFWQRMSRDEYARQLRILELCEPRSEYG